MRRRLRLTNLVCGEHRIGKSIIPQCLGERITRGGVQHLHTPMGEGGGKYRKRKPSLGHV